MVAGGHVVVFASQASNLIAGITRGNVGFDLYSYNLDNGDKSVVPAGGQLFVPTKAITCDYAGFRTLDSVVRANTE